MSKVKLIGMDSEDLEVISSHVQDAILYIRDVDYDVAKKQLNLAINRCQNEAQTKGNQIMRTHAGLVFSHVEAMQVQNIDKTNPDNFLSLLNVSFEMAESPAGTIQLNFADNASIKLSVNCLEVHLADIGEQWQSDAKPNHKL